MSGLDIQARAFVDYMSKSDGLKGKNIGIVHTNIERDASVIAAVKDQTKEWYERSPIVSFHHRYYRSC
jgi:hypothetical protein